MRKVHREHKSVKRRLWRTRCGLYAGGGTAVIIADEQFDWLPKEYQCSRCDSLRHIHRSATPEMQTTVETIVLAIHRIGQTEFEHRCWFELCRVGGYLPDGTAETRRVCTCGNISCLDVGAFEIWIDVVEVLSWPGWPGIVEAA